MDKATEKRFEKIVEHYRDIAERLGISLQELLLLVLSEQIKDISETMIPDIGSSEQESPKKATRKTTRKTTRRAQKEPQEEPPEEPGAQEMTVRELNRDQLQQLKRHYYHMKKLENGGRGATFAEFEKIDTLVTDEEIFEQFAGQKFTKEDFFI